MNYPAARSGVSSKALNAPRGGEYNPCPPQVGLSASGGFKTFLRVDHKNKPRRPGWSEIQ